MAIAKNGDKVLINYTGTLEDGTIIDTTLKHDDCCDDGDCGCEDTDCGCDDDGCGCDESGPIEFTIGTAEFIPQVEEALIGMAPGEKKTIVIPAEDAFGEYDEEEVFKISREQLTGDLTPEVGMVLELTGDDDEPVEVAVVEVADDSITVDANHPLAGEDLTYEIELLQIM